MLNQYLTDTRLLLNDPSSQVYSDAELTGYINRARNYVATLGECIYDLGTVTAPSSISTIVFNSVIPGTISSGCKLFNLRSIMRSAGQPVELRTYEWWNAYVFPNTIGTSQVIAAVFKQGYLGTIAGSFVVKAGSGITAPYDLAVTGIWLPLVLVNDSTAEDIPQLWSDAVCYYTAYLGYMRYQRQVDAQDMLSQFNQKLDWARAAATSSQLPGTMESLGGPGTQTAGGYGHLGAPQQRGG